MIQLVGVATFRYVGVRQASGVCAIGVCNWGQPLTEDKFEKRIDRLISGLVRLTHNCPESSADPNHFSRRAKTSARWSGAALCYRT